MSVKSTEYTQWHPAFCSAIKLELISNKNNLDYRSEVGLNTKPILIDLLVIRKSPDVSITKKIGAIFKGHNIFEYKSPDDSLNIDTFYKGIAYASLYKANSPRVNSIKADDITISFVRNAKPEKLFEILEKEGITIDNPSEGIYYINSKFPFAIQVIASQELDRKEYIWLTSLTDDITVEDAETIIIEASKLSEKDDKEFSESVLEVVFSKNSEVFGKIKEVPEVCEALSILMKPELDELKEKLNKTEAALAFEKEEKETLLAKIENLEKQLAKAKN